MNNYISPPAPQHHLKLVEEIYYQIFGAQLNEHRYNRLCKYETENTLIYVALPLLGKLVAHFPVPTSATIMVCDVVFALLNHQIKRGTIPMEGISPFSLKPIIDFLEVHGGSHINFETLLYILESGTKQLLDTLDSGEIINSKPSSTSTQTLLEEQQTHNDNNNIKHTNALWFVVDRIEFFNTMISKQTSINWQGSCTTIVDAFGVAAGESVPRTVENVLLNGHAHLLAAYCAMAIDSTGIPPIVNGHHFAPEKINSILSMIDSVVSSSYELINNLPLPKGYVNAFRRCKIQCEKNLKVQRERIRLGTGLHEKYSVQSICMQSLGILQTNLSNSNFRNASNDNFWEKDFRRSMLVLDPLPDEQCLILNNIRHVQVLPRLCHSYINWEDYLFRNYSCFKNDGSSRVAMDFLAETNNILRESFHVNNNSNDATRSRHYGNAATTNTINGHEYDKNMYGKHTNIFKVTTFDPDFSHPIFRGKGLKRYTVDIKIATHIDDFHHINVPQQRIGAASFTVNMEVDIEEDDAKSLAMKKMAHSWNDNCDNNFDEEVSNGSAWTADEIDNENRGNNSGKNSHVNNVSRHLFLLWNTFSDENFYFRGCWFQRAKALPNKGNSPPAIIATVEVNEEFYKWYDFKTKAGEINLVPSGIYMTNPKFGGYSSVLAVIESIVAPNTYSTSRKPVHVDDRLGTPPPKSKVWPKVPSWLITLLGSRESNALDALKSIETDIPNGIIQHQSNDTNVSETEYKVVCNSNVLGATAQQIQEGLDYFNQNRNSTTVTNVATGSRTLSNKEIVNFVTFNIRRSTWIHPDKSVLMEIKEANQRSIGDRRTLYPAQRAAIWSSLFRKVTILIGPPGTGKTDTVVEIVNVLAYNLCRSRKQRMLIVSHSNRALDQLYEAVSELYDTLNEADIDSMWSPNIVRLGGKYNKVYREDLVNADIVCMTCTGCATRRFSMKWEFDTVIVEEAAKITQPEALPFLSYNPSRIVLVGDHLQLSPVVMDPGVKERTWLEESLFQVLLRKGVQPILLNYQGRATKCICNMYRWRYPSLLDLPHVKNATTFSSLNKILSSEIFPRDLLNSFLGYHEAVPPLFIDMDYTKFDLTKSVGEKNQHEASFIKAFIHHMLQDAQKIDPTSISVLTPYKNQKQYLKSDVFEIVNNVDNDNCVNNDMPSDEKNIDIATTDEYQGLQNDIVLVSLVATGKRPSPYLSSQRRLNVLTSRSRVMFVLIGKRKTFEASKEWNAVLGKVEFLSETKLRRYIDLKSKERTKAAKHAQLQIEKGESDVKNDKDEVIMDQMSVVEIANKFLTLILKYTDTDHRSDERVKRILAMIMDLNLSYADMHNELLVKEKIVEAEMVCNQEMIEFATIIHRKIEKHASRSDVKHVQKILAMFLALERNLRARLANEDNNENDEVFFLAKLKEAEELLLGDNYDGIDDSCFTENNEDEQESVSQYILSAAKQLLPKIQLLAKNKSEQRIKKILAILLDMDESQIAKMCDNDSLLSKRIREAEELLNENHWTKRVRKVTLGEDRL